MQANDQARITSQQKAQWDDLADVYAKVVIDKDNSDCASHHKPTTRNFQQVHVASVTCFNQAPPTYHEGSSQT